MCVDNTSALCYTFMVKSKGIRVKCRLTGSLQADEKSRSFAVDALNPASCGRAFFSLPYDTREKEVFFILKTKSLQAKAGASSRVRMIAMLAILAAASVVLGKFLQIPIGDSIRISFENLPILFAGLVFGPIGGGVTGLVADLVGCIAVGYEINPVITLGAVSVGLVAGIMSRFFVREGKASLWRVLICVLFAHIIGSVILKSAGLRLWYTTPWSVLALRIPVYLANTVVESLIITALLRSGIIRGTIRDFFGKSRKA